MINHRKQGERTKSLRDDREYAMPLATQTRAVVKRAFVAYWRTPDYIMGKFILHIATGLFNTFTFYHIGYSQIDFQSRLFSIFMTLTISPPLIQQLQPKFLEFRNMFSSRENKSKIYSWFAFTTAAVIVEVPYSIVAGSVYFCTWWFGAVGRHASALASGYTFLMILLFELYYVGFGQAIATFAPNELLASLLVPLFFLFIVSFCGVVVPPGALPYFWRSWMYWLTPFHYLLEGFLAVATHGRPVVCQTTEFARFTPPPGTSCQEYTQQQTLALGGYVQTGANGLCELCAYKNGDEYARSFDVYYSHIWRDFGITLGFVLFNYAVVYVSTWLRFKGKKPWAGIFTGLAQKKVRHPKDSEKMKGHGEAEV